MIDKGEDGTSIVGVKRYDRDYHACMLETIEEMSKNLKAGNLTLDWSIFQWAKNTIEHDEILKGLEPTIYVAHEMYFPIVVGAAKAKVDKAFAKEFKAYDTYRKQGNTWVNTGRNEIMKLATSTGSPTAYSNANADAGVGNSATAPGTGDTALLGASQLYKAMDTSYPSTPASQQFDIQATFGPSEALFNWLEEAFRNGSSATVLWNRANTSLGDKTGTSETWLLQGTLTW